MKDPADLLRQALAVLLTLVRKTKDLSARRFFPFFQIYPLQMAYSAIKNSNLVRHASSDTEVCSLEQTSVEEKRAVVVRLHGRLARRESDEVVRHLTKGEYGLSPHSPIDTSTATSETKPKPMPKPRLSELVRSTMTQSNTNIRPKTEPLQKFSQMFNITTLFFKTLWTKTMTLQSEFDLLFLTLVRVNVFEKPQDLSQRVMIFEMPVQP